MWDRQRKMKENSTKITAKLSLSCLCGKHKKDSNCEVYLRNQGRWTKEMEEDRFSEMYKWLKREEPELYKKVLKRNGRDYDDDFDYDLEGNLKDTRNNCFFCKTDLLGHSLSTHKD